MLVPVQYPRQHLSDIPTVGIYVYDPSSRYAFSFFPTGTVDLFSNGPGKVYDT